MGHCHGEDDYSNPANELCGQALNTFNDVRTLDVYLLLICGDCEFLYVLNLYEMERSYIHMHAKVQSILLPISSESMAPCTAFVLVAHLSSSECPCSAGPMHCHVISSGTEWRLQDGRWLSLRWQQEDEDPTRGEGESSEAAISSTGSYCI